MRGTAKSETGFAVEMPSNVPGPVYGSLRAQGQHRASIGATAASMGRASVPLIFLADMHQGHDQKICKEVAPVVMGEHNQYFHSISARLSATFSVGTLMSSSMIGELISEISSAQLHIIMKTCLLGLTVNSDDLTSLRRSVTVAVHFLVA